MKEFADAAADPTDNAFMELSRLIGLAAVVLIVVVAAGYAVAEPGADAPAQAAAAK